MGIVSKTYTFSAGATIFAAEHNTNFDTLYNVVNGDLSNANISASAAIAYSKLNLNASLQLSDFSAAVLATIYPVGSIYTNASVSTNPATLLGFGTWTAFGAGRVMVGINAADADFDTAEEIGGAKTHTLSTDEIPAHSHEQATLYKYFGATSPGPTIGGDGINNPLTPTTANAGGGNAHNNLQPYIVVYMWKRTA
jgi:hypothetical protein